MGWERVDERRPEWQSFETQSPFEKQDHFAEQAPGNPFVDESHADAGDDLDEVPAVAALGAFDETERDDAAMVQSVRPGADTEGRSMGDPFSTAVQLEMSAFAEADALEDLDDGSGADAGAAPTSWSDDGWTDTEDDFDEIFGLDASRAQEASDAGVAFDTALDGHSVDNPTEHDALLEADFEADEPEEAPTSVWGQTDAETSTIAARIDAAPTVTDPDIELRETVEACDVPEDLSDSREVDTLEVDSRGTDFRGVGVDEDLAEEAPASLPTDEVDEDEISFDDIFPPKVNQPEPEYDDVEETHMPPRMGRMAGTQALAQRDDASGSASVEADQRSLFGGDDPEDPRVPLNKPVASVPENSPSGPPRLDVRPDYMPSRQGATAGLAVDSSSPLLGRAFGFVQRD